MSTDHCLDSIAVEPDPPQCADTSSMKRDIGRSTIERGRYQSKSGLKYKDQDCVDERKEETKNIREWMQKDHTPPSEGQVKDPRAEEAKENSRDSLSYKGGRKVKKTYKT